MLVDRAWDYQPKYPAVRYGAYARALPNPRSQRVLANMALAGVAFACAWTLYTNLAGNSNPGYSDLAANLVEVTASRGDKLVVATRGDKLAVAPQAAAPRSASNAVAALFDPRYTLGGAPETFAPWRSASTAVAANNAAEPAPQAEPRIAAAMATAAAKATHEIPAAPANAHAAQQVAAAAAPVPPPTPAALHEHKTPDRIAADKPAETPTIFERLFGRPGGNALAYASPDDGVTNDGHNPGGHYDRDTAIYDISAHTVFMPDGTRLEAHSGLGSLLDDPHYASARNRGVTPPAVYDLQLREAPFHGVRALRLIPVDESKVFGRSGLLAHSYMLGPNGDSNGCVSFRNYEAFLQAYLNHGVKRLVVVAGRE